MHAIAQAGKCAVLTAPTFVEALRFWLKLGFISFGGPAGQIAIMHRELVERRRWISEARFLHALNYCMLLPGPEAQQLATYLGWLMHRTAGGALAGLLFVLPGMVLLVLLAWAYVSWNQHAVVAGVFYGIKPVVVALVLLALVKLGRRVLHRRLWWAIAVASWLALAVFGVPFPLIILAALAIGFIASALGAPVPAATDITRADGDVLIGDHTPLPPHAHHSVQRLLVIGAIGVLLWALPLLLLRGLSADSTLLVDLALFFTKAALLTFGGAYAVLPYVQQAAVDHFGWLSAGQMLDGLALGETTPGPLILIVTFVGFLAGWQDAGLALQWGPLVTAVIAAGTATWFTFLPSFVFIFAGGPFVESSRRIPALTVPLASVSAAVVGVMVNLALFLAGHVMLPQGVSGTPEWPALGLSLLAFVALYRYNRGTLEVVAAGALAGLVISSLF